MAPSQGILDVVKDTLTDQIGNFQPHAFSTFVWNFPDQNEMNFGIKDAMAKLYFSSHLSLCFPNGS